ncbi:hypothetical protein MICRO11B_210085 [Micrococcus luteus]|nr:hypothetical protein MICRO11B_210085 [Micrococcus luteus]
MHHTCAAGPRLSRAGLAPAPADHPTDPDRSD